MKNILFTPGIGSVEALGSITRLISIADEIRKREKNCNILFRSSGREAEYALACGYKTVHGYKPKIDMKNFFQNLKNKGCTKSGYSVDSLCDVMKFKGLVSREYIENTFKEELELVEKFKPDVIVGEFETVMPIVAKKMNIPYFCTGGTPNRKDFNCFGFDNSHVSGDENNYNELLRKLNLKEIENICELNQDYYNNKIFIPSIPELEELDDSSNYVYLGSLSPKNFIKSEFKFEKKRPLIYVYLSVGGIKPEVYKKVILETFSGSEFDVIVTTGGNPVFSTDDEKSHNVHFKKMVQSDKVMKIADVAIHHGGQNTTVQCIENEVPAIIYSGNHFERYFNGEKAQQIGCAVHADVNNFNKEFLLETCRKIINDHKIKQQLKVYSEQIKNCGGAAKAAHCILNY